MWNDFKNLCDDCLSLIPSKVTSTKNHQPWISPFIKRLSRRKQRCYNRAKHSHCAEEWQLYYRLKKECQRECQRAYNAYINSFIEAENGNVTKRLWSFIKHQKKDQCSIPPIHVNDTTLTDSQEKSNAFNDYFTSVFTQEDLSAVPTMNGIPFPEIPHISISEEGVANLLRTLNHHKATGPDNIPAYFLKELSEELAPILTLIFQSSLHQGFLPDDWKVANIIPIFKKGSRTQTCNYRPVSLTSICSKILEHIVYSCIFSHLTNYNILAEEQHGFQVGKSCETQLITTIDDLVNCLNDNAQMDCIFLDFSKAFDRVPHSRLCNKLSHYGIRGPLLSWIKHYLYNRSQKVTIDGTSSNSSIVTSGVPQGTVLAPLLFLCFVNYIPLNIASKIKLYADDILLYRKIKTRDDQNLLQDDINRLVKWSKDWQLLFNFNKCEFLCITNKRSPLTITYRMDGTAIKQVSSVKYLGITINEKLNWSEHISNISKKASSVLGFLHRNLKSCPPHIKESCYKSLVIPILEYSCTVWDPHTQKDILMLEKIQRRASRFVTNSYSWSVSVTNLINNLGWKSLQNRRACIKATMMYKISNNLINMPCNQSLIPCTSHTRHHQLCYQLPYSRINTHLYSFFPSAIRLWNSLSQQTINSPTLDHFKRTLIIT